MQNSYWDDIRNELRSLLPSHVYSAYVEQARLEHLDNAILSLSFNDSFSKENFEHKCQAALENVLKKRNMDSVMVSLAVIPRPEEKKDISPYAYPHFLEHGPFDPKYTFDTYVVGGSNQFAHAAAQAVAKRPGQCYNPLFIFGGAGLGKTHLLKAVGYEISLLKRDLRVFYLTSESFTNELIHAIRTDRMRDFREKYRVGCDVLLLDDIHFLAGKERTQEEFFFTFNYLHESRKQIVITSDRFPKDIEGLEARLQTRFEWGLVADIQPPEMETRSAILKNKAETDGIDLPDSVAQYIAGTVTSNIRELEGALHRLQAYATLTGAPVSVDLAKQIFKGITPQTKHEISADGILKLVALHYNIRTTDLRSAKKIRKLSYPRQVCMYLLRKHLLMSFPEIGKFLNKKDHTTILHGVTKIAESLRTKDEVVKDITEIEDMIR